MELKLTKADFEILNEAIECIRAQHMREVASETLQNISEKMPTPDKNIFFDAVEEGYEKAREAARYYDQLQMKLLALEQGYQF